MSGAAKRHNATLEPVPCSSGCSCRHNGTWLSGLLWFTPWPRNAHVGPKKGMKMRDQRQDHSEQQSGHMLTYFFVKLQLAGKALVTGFKENIQPGLRIASSLIRKKLSGKHPVSILEGKWREHQHELLICVQLHMSSSHRVYYLSDANLKRSRLIHFEFILFFWLFWVYYLDYMLLLTSK